MALTQVKTTGIADDAVTLAKQAAGTDGQIITYDASGNPVAVGPGTDGQVLTSTGAGSPPAFEDAAASVGGASGVDFNDNVKIRAGTGNDFSLYHSGSNNILESGGTTEIHVNKGDTENMAKFIPDGAVELYHNNVKKLETASTGMLMPVTGADASTALQLNGTNGSSETASLIIENDGGNSRTDFKYNTGNGTPDLNMRFTADATELYYDNSKKIETTSAGATITGNLTVTGTSPGGIANAVVFRKTADTTGNCLPVTDWEKEDGLYLPGEIGTFSDPSSGVFTFPSTGYWYVIAVMTGVNSGSSVSSNMWVQINVTNDNGSYWSSNSISHDSCAVSGHTSATTTHLLDVEDTSNDKVKISLGAAYGSEVFKGDSTQNETHVTFIRLGDT